MRRAYCGAASALAWFACALPARAAELRLVANDLGPFDAGDSVIITVAMADLGGSEAAGFQAFLSFDSAELVFLGGSYVSTLFGQPVIPIIQAVGENIDLASGVDIEEGQLPTSADGDLANLFFEALTGFCRPAVAFRDHEPPHRITTDQGMEILPLDLLFVSRGAADCNGNDIDDSCDIDDGTSRDCNQNGVPDECEVLTCPADFTGPGGLPDGVVDVIDLLLLLALWNLTGCADFTGSTPGVPDGVVNVVDLLGLLAAWGPCPP